MPPDSETVYLVGPAAAALDAVLGELGARTKTTSFTDIYAAGTAALSGAPRAIFADLALLGPADLGALRLLRRSLPECPIALLAAKSKPDKSRAALADDAAAIGVRLCREQPSPSELADILARPATPPVTGVEAALVAGIADELNNPLAALAGRIQLLRSVLAERGNDAESLAQMRALCDRMQASLERLALLAPRKKPALAEQELWPILLGLVDEERAGRLDLRAEPRDGARVRTDAGVASLALDAILRVLADLAAPDGRVRASFDARDRSLTLGLEAPVPMPCDESELFEPYRLRGVLCAGVGLDLAIARTLLAAVDAEVWPLRWSGFLAGLVVNFRR